MLATASITYDATEIRNNVLALWVEIHLVTTLQRCQLSKIIGLLVRLKGRKVVGKEEQWVERSRSAAGAREKGAVQ